MFNETRLLDCVAYGSQFGHEFNTTIVALKSGAERRKANWSMPLGRGAVIYTALEPADHYAVRAAHMASLGSAIPFRFKDWTDYQAEAEPFGEGIGSLETYQLVKRYAFGPITLERIILKPVSVQVFADGSPIAATVDLTTGVVEVNATFGAALTWTGDFDIPVRFVSDRLDTEPVARSGDGFMLTCDVDLIEVRL